MVRCNDSARRNAGRKTASALCLEEVPADRELALRRFGEAAGRSGAQILEGFARFTDAARQLGVSLTQTRQAVETAGWPAMHAFTPDLDLRCSVKGCGLGPEEHG